MAFLAPQDLKVAFLNREFRKVAILNFRGRHQVERESAQS